MSSSSYSEEQLSTHQRLLEQEVFQVETKWPHFRQLLREIRKLASDFPPSATVVSLERGLLYGGISLLGPFFHRHEFVSVDCSPPSADERGAYNTFMVDNEGLLRVPTTHRAPIEATGLDSEIADLVVIPNLVHHVRDQRRLFCEMARITRPGGSVYVFEPLLRELHQIPDDYLRYTPFGLMHILEEVGLECGGFELEGGPFSAIAYCWDQALQYFPADKREEMQRWFDSEHFPQLMQWDEEFQTNRVRDHTSFPVSFSVVARKHV